MGPDQSLSEAPENQGFPFLLISVGSASQSLCLMSAISISMCQEMAVPPKLIAVPAY